MSDAARRFRETVVRAVLQGPGRASADARRAAFDNARVPAGARALLDKVARCAWKVTDEDVVAAKAAGLSDDEIYELVVSAALGQSTRQLESAHAALAAAGDDGPNPTAGGPASR